MARKSRERSWTADAQQSALQDRHRPGKTVRIGEGGQVADRLTSCGGRLVGQTQDNDAGMTAWRVCADVTQPAVQGNQDPPRRGGCGNNVSVQRADQALLSDGIDVVTGASQDRGRRDGQILVELKFHRDCGSGSSSSRASAAP